ncbi:MAG TPA: protein kinase, partial [Myxococcota bacterium]|nr:protein kinase [Myxococcota bacterium]
MSRDEVRVGEFQLEERVGGGGMGVVYKGRDRNSGAAVAVKLLSPEARGERARFEREALALHAVRHPRVVRYLEHGVTAEGTPYLAMEWLEGCDLSVRLRAGPLG